MLKVLAASFPGMLANWFKQTVHACGTCDSLVQDTLTENSYLIYTSNFDSPGKSLSTTSLQASQAI